MCSHNQLSTKLECTAKVRDQSTVGADHPGQPTLVDRSPNLSKSIVQSPVVTGLCCNQGPCCF